ncbi:adenosylmethionine decarboxylase [Adhaeribacter arboris]|uniref:Adenosylmethionine decarboxylase n=1 Tax=Adhaeribacter arboris TaxID=2072846 RepID=A0A2T2YNV1_9BACT|nr:adenosylmethionine decarboxylase [Adhaeribacter arboris]PSR57166.1 adenosylmethionine decarboxylase [Adhaeribacter arboris]
MAFEPLTYLLDCSVSDFQKLEDPEFTLQLLEDIRVVCDFQVISRNYKKFHPQGLTAMLLLAESHISIHTWPEKELFCIDIFTCKGKINLSAIIQLLQNKLPNLVLLQAEEISRRVYNQNESIHQQEAAVITRIPEK